MKLLMCGPSFEGYATKIGLDLDRFQARHRQRCRCATHFPGRKARAFAGRKGTPTVFLNGREVPFESLEPDKLHALINAAVAGHP